jgi:hypothetical protein
MEQVKIGKFISDERKAKGYTRNNYLNCWESVIKQYRNGSVEFPIVNWNPSFQFASLSSDLANHLQK